MVLTLLMVETKTSFIDLPQDIFLYQILKRDLVEKIDNFGKILEKISEKKKDFLIHLIKNNICINQISKRLLLSL